MKLLPLKLEPLAIASIEASWAEAPNLKQISMKRATLAFALTVDTASAALAAEMSEQTTNSAACDVLAKMSW